MISLKKYPIAFRLVLIEKTISLFFIIGIFFSFKLWTSTRFFPIVPAIWTFPKFKSPLDLIIVFVLISLFIAIIFLKERKIYYFILGLLLLLLIQDQLRWQPWVYMYFLMLIPFSFGQFNKEQEIINYLQIILIGIYIWSGINKFNANFIDYTFKDILTDLFKIEYPILLDKLKILGYLIPAIEIFIGLAFLIPKTRNAGVYLAIITHIFILLFLSSSDINHNSVVYPWNIAMIFFVLLLFWEVNNKILIWQLESVKMKILTKLLVVFIGILPLLNFLNLWDNYLSFSLYSDKNKIFCIAIEDTELKKIDKRYNPYFMEIKGITGGKIIDINKWSMSELNVPFYPERRVFKKICRKFCNLGIMEEKLIFLEIEKSSSSEKGSYYSFTCKDLSFE